MISAFRASTSTVVVVGSSVVVVDSVVGGGSVVGGASVVATAVEPDGLRHRRLDASSSPPLHATATSTSTAAPSQRRFTAPEPPRARRSAKCNRPMPTQRVADDGKTGNGERLAP